MADVGSPWVSAFGTYDDLRGARRVAVVSTLIIVFAGLNITNIDGRSANTPTPCQREFMQFVQPNFRSRLYFCRCIRLLCSCPHCVGSLATLPLNYDA